MNIEKATAIFKDIHNEETEVGDKLTAIQAADHMPEHTYRDYCILRAMAYRMGLKITRIKDLGSGKEWSR